VTDGVRDHQGQPALPERDGVVPVPARGARRRGPVVAAGQPQVRQEREGRRQEGVLRLLHDVDRRRPPCAGGGGGLRFDHQKRGRYARDLHRPDDDARRPPVGAQRSGQGDRSTGPEHLRDHVGHRPSVDGGCVVTEPAECPRLRVRPDRLRGGCGHAEDRRRRILHCGEQRSRTLVRGAAGTGWHTAGADAHPTASQQQRSDPGNTATDTRPRGAAPEILPFRDRSGGVYEPLGRFAGCWSGASHRSTRCSTTGMMDRDCSIDERART
jgi:hypothetical protein